MTNDPRRTSTGRLSSHKTFLRQRLKRDLQHLSCQFQRPLRANANALPEATYPPYTADWVAAATEPAATPAAVNPIAVKAAGAAAMVRPPVTPVKQTSGSSSLL